VHQLIWLTSIQNQKESLPSFPSVNNPEKSRNKTTKYKEKNLMSIASLTQFQNEVMQDSALQEQFKTAAATSPESLGELALKLGADRGYSFTLEDIQSTVEAASSYPSVEDELTDEELEMVSGGGSLFDHLTRTNAKVTALNTQMQIEAARQTIGVDMKKKCIS
jgi:predicted ribosomally synthesized peptide with nif11-like leader